MLIFRFWVFLIALMCFNTESNSQNYMYIGSDRYPSTSTWSFKSGSSIAQMQGGVDVSIGKRGSEGLLMLSSNEHIEGAVYVFLENGERIICYERKRDKLDGKHIVLYYFTKNEINKLKTFKIELIRYSVQKIHIHGVIESTESYTATNQYRDWDKDLRSITKKHNTALEVRRLFGN